MKVKIIKPVTLGGKLHHKVGAVVEVSPAHARRLVEDGWAEKASESAPLTPGATIEATRTPVTPNQEGQQQQQQEPPEE